MGILFDSLRRGNALVVATRAVLAELHRDQGRAVSRSPTDAEFSQTLHGATPRWFGPRMLGTNRFRDFRTCIVIGRHQPPVSATENAMRALFGDEGDLAFAPGGHLEGSKSGRLMMSGDIEYLPRQSHPDPRGQAVLEQTRECLTQQAVARLRLTSPSGPKRVLLLSNLPLPDLPATRLTTFADLVAGLDEEAFPGAWRRLEAALASPHGPAVSCLRLSAAGLHEDLPWEFPTLNAAKEFRRGLTTEDLWGVIDRLARRYGWPVTRLNLRRSGEGGRSTPAVAFLAPSAVPSKRNEWPGMNVDPVGPGEAENLAGAPP